jgi:hypothetical protein
MYRTTQRRMRFSTTVCRHVFKRSQLKYSVAKTLYQRAHRLLQSLPPINPQSTPFSLSNSQSRASRPTSILSPSSWVPLLRTIESRNIWPLSPLIKQLRGLVPEGFVGHLDEVMGKISLKELRRMISLWLEGTLDGSGVNFGNDKSAEKSKSRERKAVIEEAVTLLKESWTKGFVKAGLRLGDLFFVGHVSFYVKY